MYKNVGSTIKTLAKVCAIIGIIFGILVGIGFIFAGIHTGQIEFLIVGIALGALLVFFSWLGQVMLYGYGELIDSNDEISNKLDEVIAAIKNK